jgi:outer membrane protein assembly factor BamB
VGVKKCLRGLRVAGAAVLALGLAWCCMSCSPLAGRVPSPPGAGSARPGGQLWARTLPRACCLAGAVSPDGTTVFVSGSVQPPRGQPLVRTHFETVAYRAATGARLWASPYQPGGFGRPVAMTVSRDGARVYVTGDTIAPGQGVVTIAYNARTGRQLWASRYMPKGPGARVSGLAVSPDGTTLYLTGSRGLAQSEFAVIAYAAATGKQRWLRYYTKVKPGYAESVAVSPDGKTVYATGFAGSSALTVAYGAAGTLNWATRYKDPYGFAAGSQIVAGPGGGAVYIAGKAANKNGHVDVATFAYRAATGTRMWLNRHDARITGSLLPAPEIAVTPGGQTVSVTVPLGQWRPAPYAIAAYHAGTGRTRWARLAPATTGTRPGWSSARTETRCSPAATAPRPTRSLTAPCCGRQATTAPFRAEASCRASSGSAATAPACSQPAIRQAPVGASPSSRTRREHGQACLQTGGRP